MPRHDEWFDKFAQDWGKQVGVDVTVDHIEVTGIPTRIASEISASSGHDVIQFIAPLPQFEPSVVDMSDVTQEASERFGKQIELCLQEQLQPDHPEVLRLQPGLGPGSRQLPQEHVGDRPASRTALDRGTS